MSAPKTLKPIEKLLSRLNAPQREAAVHKDGPLLVLAGAGSGKTTTMATRIAYLVAKHGVSAENILGLSFTRKAANELRERVVRMVSETSGPDRTDGLTLSTFHALCVRILRLRGAAIGFHPGFTILDESDQGELISSILKQIKIDDRKFDREVIRFEIGQAKNRFLDPESARDFFLNSKRMPEDYAIVACSVYEHYQDRLKALNSLDFDDLLFQAVTLLEKDPAARAYYNSKFKYILVDEYQDTNPAQFRLLSLLTEKQKNICVVGDDDQSIYAWRGADPAHILEFSKHFKGAKTITLDQNYRSTSMILDAANKVIQQNPKRHPKKLWSDKGMGKPITQIIVEEDRPEAEAVADEILRRVKDPKNPKRYQDFAILYRSNPQSRLFEEALRSRRVPYKIVGTMSFLERKEVKDALSYWRLVQNFSDDASFRRIVNWPSRGIGKSTIDQLSTHAIANGISLFEAATALSSPENESLGPKTKTALLGFVSLMRSMREDLERTPLDREAMSNWGRRTHSKIDFKTKLFDDEEDPKIAEKKWENVDELSNALGQIDLKTNELTTSLDALSEFLQAMTLDPDEDEDEDDSEKDEVTLLTLHGSKGLEFPLVFMVGCEEGYLPHQRTINEGIDFSEERRLCYVGITRAKDELVLTRAKHRIRYGKKIPRLQSRFLQDIPKECLLIQDESLAPEPTNQAAKEAHEAQVKNFFSSMRSKIGADGK